MQPERFVDKIKRFFWLHIIYPVFPFIRDGLVNLHIIHHRGRQPWHIGWLAPGHTVEGLVRHVAQHGFGNHFIAWTDAGQILSLRRHDGFKFQYHLRVFRDRELRGHYEETPEADPLEHFTEKIFQARTEQFKEWLGSWVVDEHPETRAKLSDVISIGSEDEKAAIVAVKAMAPGKK